MNTDQSKSHPMNATQLTDVKKKIIQTYLYLVSRTGLWSGHAQPPAG